MKQPNYYEQQLARILIGGPYAPTVQFFGVDKQRTNHISLTEESSKAIVAKLVDAFGTCVLPDPQIDTGAAYDATLFAKVTACDVPFTHVDATLRIPVNPLTNHLISRYLWARNVTTYRNPEDGQLWYNVPLAYSPHFKQLASAPDAGRI